MNTYIGYAKEIVGAIIRVTGEKDFDLGFSEREEFGDYSTNIALIQSPVTNHQSPRKKAEEIVRKLEADRKLSKVVEKIQVAGPGFINFWLKKDVLINNLIQIDSLGEKYGKTNFLKGKRINFEYGDANTHKLPHIGHIFSYIYGESMCRILETAGANVFRASYQGDIGLHVAKCLWAFKSENPKVPPTLDEKTELLLKVYRVGSKAYEESREAKKAIQALNKQIYDGGGELEALWKETRGWSVEYYDRFESRLGIKYDRHYYESEVQKKGAEIVNKSLGKVFKKSEGAIIFEGSKYGLHDRVFLTNYGTPTYEAKDMYLQELKREEWSMDLCIITTANEQNAYFDVIFKALETLNESWTGKLKHIGFGMISLEGGKMSSRAGKIIGAENLVDTAVAEVKKIVDSEEGLSDSEKDEISETVGIGAVKYSFLKNNPLQDTKFDMEESIAKEGNSGPYIQYTVARTNSVLAKIKYQKSNIKNTNQKLNINEEELKVLRALSRFSEVIADSAKSYSPNLLCNYLFDLAQKYNNFYNVHRIIGSDNLGLRLRLTSATGQVLRNGLKLLGIQAPERM